MYNPGHRVSRPDYITDGSEHKISLANHMPGGTSRSDEKNGIFVSTQGR